MTSWNHRSSISWRISAWTNWPSGLPGDRPDAVYGKHHGEKWGHRSLDHCWIETNKSIISRSVGIWTKLMFAHRAEMISVLCMANEVSRQSLTSTYTLTFNPSSCRTHHSLGTQTMFQKIYSTLSLHSLRFSGHLFLSAQDQASSVLGKFSHTELHSHSSPQSFRPQYYC